MNFRSYKIRLSTAVSPLPSHRHNSDGHIIRFLEDNNNPVAVGFTWDIFVFGSAVDGMTNFSGLTLDNEFTDCDGLWFDATSLLWIQTDGGQPNGNNQMLAAIPGQVGDGDITPANNATNLRRFLVEPVDCEIAGITCLGWGDLTRCRSERQHPGCWTPGVSGHDRPRKRDRALQ